MDIVALITSAFKTIGEFFGYQSKRLDLKNAPKVQAAQEAQNEVDAAAKGKNAIAKQDVKETREELAE